MKANELRLNNYVKHNGNFYQVEEISDEWLQIDNYQLNTELNEIEPIPLTEEILLKCGFFEGQIGYYFLNDITISVEGQVYFGDEETWVAELQYLHQLQNLYFALTNQELEINL